MKPHKLLFLVSGSFLITYIFGLCVFLVVDKSNFSDFKLGIYIFIFVIIPIIYFLVFFPLILKELRQNKRNIFDSFELFESLNMSIVIFNTLNRKIEYCSKNLYTLYGIDINDVLASNKSKELYGVNIQKELIDFILNKKTNQDTIVMDLINPNTKEKRALESRILKYDINDNIYYISIIQDVTSSYEQKLLLTNKLNEARESAVTMQEMLTKVSHEIRTPLNGIIGMNKIAIDELENKDYDKVKSSLKMVESSGKYLFSVISNVLTASKLDHSQMELTNESFKIKDLILEVISMVSSQARTRNVNISYHIDDEELIVVTDRLKLMQIILNLVSNGIKYNKEKGKILINVKSSSLLQNKVNVTFSIEDNGIGMTEDFIEKLFTPYAKENRQNEYPSTGLGLVITKSLVLRLNGKINVNSILNVGTTFKVEFVFDSVIVDKEVKEEINDFDFTNMNCLVVEDNEINAIICQSYLDKLNIKHSYARNGEEACRIFFKEHEHTFDFILMDIQMPVLNGYEAASRIRKSSRIDNNLPIISLTADAFKDDVEKALLYGMNGHISKPIMLDNLKNTLSQVLGDFYQKNKKDIK